MVRPWHRSPEKGVGAPSLSVHKTRLDGALDIWSMWGVPGHRRGWDWVGFEVPSYPNQSVILLFYDSMIYLSHKGEGSWAVSLIAKRSELGIAGHSCFLQVWCMRKPLFWDCIKEREMRFQRGIQISWGKTPTLALLTNLSYIIFIHSLTPFLACIYWNLFRRKSELLRYLSFGLRFSWILSRLMRNEKTMRNKKPSWCLLGTRGQS